MSPSPLPSALLACVEKIPVALEEASRQKNCTAGFEVRGGKERGVWYQRYLRQGQNSLTQAWPFRVGLEAPPAALTVSQQAVHTLGRTLRAVRCCFARKAV